MSKKNYVSPETDIVFRDQRDVVCTSGYVDATEGADDNIGKWGEVFK